ncbi:hypothetical protein PAXINDRAFT_171928 [Paxillus involutus ATCC 200175]|uniref:Thioesterase domain-containing protein n=1 Tax=Paxillus involutus ATCC 200175 TaxID=664439 RepID=A0A0C9TTI4_PAXIN|nr:hypothetical protein PAXINDRAFT_171928 [Paxillus involutus ATCC 200175]
MDTREWIDAAAIGGNASKELKQSLLDLVTAAAKSVKVRGIRGFEPEIASRLEWTEISVLRKAEEREKLEGRVGFETTVEDDNCSIMPIALLRLATTGKADLGVSQSINILFHAPAMAGDRLRIVGTTISLGSRTLSSRCEIWNATHHRLVASGVHTGMSASDLRASSRL